METHSSVLAWRIPGTGEPGGLPSMGSHRVGHDWSNLAAAAAATAHTYPLYLLTPTLDWISKEPASFRSLSQAWASTVPNVGSEPPNPTRPASSGAQDDRKHSPARATLRHVSATVFLCIALRMDLNHRMESLLRRPGIWKSGICFSLSWRKGKHISKTLPTALIPGV